MHEWYYSAADGQHRGPFPAAEMQALAARGVITASTLVWREGYPQWRPLAEAGELAQPTGLPPALPAAAAVARIDALDRAAARAAVAERFTVDVMAERYLALYRDILG